MKYDMPHKGDKDLLWDAVAELPCQYPGCGKHGVQVSHSNQSRDGKGMGLKSFPYRVAAICPEHHIEIDSGRRLSRAERIEAWEEAHRSTIGELFARGRLRPARG